MRRAAWRVGWAASVVAHVVFFALPTPGSARHAPRAASPLTLELELRSRAPEAPAPPPDAPPVPAPESPPPESPPPRAPARRPPPEPRSSAESAVAVEAPSPPPSPALPKRAADAPAAPAPSEAAPAPADLDLELHARGDRFVPGGSSAASARFAPRLETSAVPEGLEPSGDGSYTYDSRGFTARIARDGSVSFTGGRAIETRGTGFAFDVTEAVMSAAGDDAFHPDKIAFLERTAWFRDRLAARAREDDLRGAQRETLARLRAIWGDGTLPAAERRRELFEMWDDCRESGPEDVVATGRFVRATVLAFIQRRLPADSPDAFSPDELERLNAGRASAEPFAPYAR